MKKRLAFIVIAAVVLAGCATKPDPTEADAKLGDVVAATQPINDRFDKIIDLAQRGAARQDSRK